MLIPVAARENFLTADETTLLKELAIASEKNRSLLPGLLEQIHQKGWFRMFIPERYGGAMLPLPDAAALEEHLARIDGSLGWTVTLCSGAGWFCGFVSPEIINTFFSGPYCCIAGSGAPGGTAHRSGNRFVVSGTWKYATGAPHATAFTANCFIHKEDGSPEYENGAPMVRAFLVRREEVKLLNNWNSIGMVASASSGFSIEALEIPADRCFHIHPDSATSDHPVYQYPFLQLAEVTLAANISGMVCHFLDICTTVFSADAYERRCPAKQVSLIRKELAAAIEEIEQLRNAFYAALRASWEYCENAKTIPPELLEYVSRTSRMLASAALHWTDALYPYGGLGFADTTTDANRVWRDIHTASQHSLLMRNHGNDQ